tara:strand:- start:523 stop:693 length:171 start_codon:yes stop_codon:yes gene_type:complete
LTDDKEHAENSANLAQCKRGTSPHNAEQSIAEQRIAEQRIVGPDTALMLNRGMHHE